VISSQTVGLPENHPTTKLLQVYPNPFSTTTTIRFANPKGLRHGLRVMDAQGRVVTELEASTGDDITFDRGELSSGMYFFQLLAGEKVVGRGKLMVE
jgi:hypothetical protein